jgi:hypothetical protein
VNVDLINRIVATIRRVDGGHTMGAGQLAEAIVGDLPKFENDDRVIVTAVDALVADGWEETHEGPMGIGTLTHDDLANIARIVLRSLGEG